MSRTRIGIHARVMKYHVSHCYGCVWVFFSVFKLSSCICYFLFFCCFFMISNMSRRQHSSTVSATADIAFANPDPACRDGVFREPNHDEGVSGREGGMPGGGMPAFRGAGGAPPGGLHCWHHL